jgi:hypothetical protein
MVSEESLLSVPLVIITVLIHHKYELSSLQLLDPTTGNLVTAWEEFWVLKGPRTSLNRAKKTHSLLYIFLLLPRETLPVQDHQQMLLSRMNEVHRNFSY